MQKVSSHHINSLKGEGIRSSEHPEEQQNRACSKLPFSSCLGQQKIPTLQKAPKLQTYLSSLADNWNQSNVKGIPLHGTVKSLQKSSAKRHYRKIRDKFGETRLICFWLISAYSLSHNTIELLWFRVTRITLMSISYFLPPIIPTKTFRECTLKLAILQIIRSPPSTPSSCPSSISHFAATGRHLLATCTCGESYWTYQHFRGHVKYQKEKILLSRLF